MYVSPPLKNISYRRSCLFGFTQRLCTNAVIWKQLRYPNVVTFLGFDSDPPPFSLVYPWMSNGSLSEYLHEHPDADKLRLVCGAFRTAINLLNDPYRLLIIVIGCRSWAGIPTSTQSDSWELNRSEFWFSRPEMRGKTYNPVAQHSGGW